MSMGEAYSKKKKTKRKRKRSKHSMDTRVLLLSPCPHHGHGHHCSLLCHLSPTLVARASHAPPFRTRAASHASSSRVVDLWPHAYPLPPPLFSVSHLSILNVFAFLLLETARYDVSYTTTA